MSNIKMKTRFDPGVVFMFYSENGVKKLPSKNHPYGRCISPKQKLKVQHNACSISSKSWRGARGIAPNSDFM